jgi:hypothetical protein
MKSGECDVIVIGRCIKVSSGIGDVIDFGVMMNRPL